MTQLTMTIIGEIKRLGGQVTITANPDPAYISEYRIEVRKGQKHSVPGPKHQLPEPMRQFIHDVTWPKRHRYENNEESEIEVWLVKFVGQGWVNPEHYRLQEEPSCPLCSIGQTDGGNYTLCFRLDDDNPSDPLVYTLDHDWPGQTLGDGIPLSVFLRSLQQEGG